MYTYLKPIEFPFPVDVVVFAFGSKVRKHGLVQLDRVAISRLFLRCFHRLTHSHFSIVVSFEAVEPTGFYIVEGVECLRVLWWTNCHLLLLITDAALVQSLAVFVENLVDEGAFGDLDMAPLEKPRFFMSLTLL
jgi:hypothetical protein